MTDASNKQVIYSDGIFHGLPDLSGSAKGMTAVVTGANGISGTYMIRVLCKHPERWTKIYAFSRKPPTGEWPKQVEHVPIDFLENGPKEIAASLKERSIKPDHIFFFSYILPWVDGKPLAWGNPELTRVNDLLLRNFLEALPMASALPKRLFVQTGGKYYGVHLGPTLIPSDESDPRIPFEPNLYYAHEDFLREFCPKHGIHYNMSLPSFILGAPQDSTQSLVYPVAVYAAVQKHLGKRLEYPSDLTSWETLQSISSGTLNSYLFEWMVLNENAKDQSINASDNCDFSWGKFWPKLAKYYGIEYIGPDTEKDTQFKEVATPYEPPPRGFGPRAIMKFRFSFVEWAKRSEVTQAWKELAEKHDLQHEQLKDIESVFGRADFALARSFSSVLSSTKAKKLGWFGFVDTAESWFQVLEEWVQLKVIPPI